ncbi:class II glutamine amidotransferase [Mycobacterium vicinigordonae]|uniref:Class II glutamine amidotransferase n=1 Tax=Mycobacterium vicinigordonae TaxID=1719132 RepID=A0A7D6HSP6_9MYCO|nr:class II glutamine amidotransferase [Mycobacterium vicinigordonae]QLL06472.1 class II glutamine amidotransferase [Mycobacterium vicinigordonae]
MCRLFGLHAGTEVVTATFWLLDAPDSLARQSRQNPDGSGIGVFDERGRAQLFKEPIAAWRDHEFATEAHRLTGTTFIAHVRYSTTGSKDVLNTHPFLQDGRIFAHNGMIEGLQDLDKRLRELGTYELVLGETDSERVFALITASIRAHGDVSTGIVEAIGWIAANVPIYAVNILLCMGTQMWALRYPDTHQLFMLDRRVDGEPDFDMSTVRIHAQSDTLAERSAVLFATEPMDDDPRWSLLDPGELVHVNTDLEVTRTLVLPDPPRQLLRRDDLAQPVFRAQHALPGMRHPAPGGEK